MKLEEAKNVLDSLVAQSRLTRQEHIVLQEALNTLYSHAKDNEEIEKIPVSPDA